MSCSRHRIGSHIFELESAGVTHCPVEVRHPFFDLRVVNYLLALPPFPLFFEKRLLREAVAGRLPESIRSRRKSPLAGDPLLALLGQRHTPWMDDLVWTDRDWTLMLISPRWELLGNGTLRRKWTEMFALSVSTFGCSQRAESGITCVRRFAMVKPRKTGGKKPYSSPIITMYGTVQELTQHKPGSSGHDGGTRPLNRTG